MAGHAGRQWPVQIPVGEVECGSLDVYELVALGGAQQWADFLTSTMGPAIPPKEKKEE